MERLTVCVVRRRLQGLIVDVSQWPLSLCLERTFYLEYSLLDAVPIIFVLRGEGVARSERVVWKEGWGNTH